jgi:cation transport protein ChaC
MHPRQNNTTGVTPRGKSDLWVFAYGSLMWRPDFPSIDCQPALLRGYHRALRVESTHYRGVPGRPGLVLGLDRGGSCRGRAHRVAPAEANAVMTYLDERELITGVYRRAHLPVRLPGATVVAAAYIVNRDHDQYTGKLNLSETVAMVLQGHGSTGSARGYLRNTVAHLDNLGIREGALHRIFAAVEAEAAERDRTGSEKAR